MKLSKKLTVINKAGFHLRVASMICKRVIALDADVFLVKGSYRANCKSCLDLLAIMAPLGTELQLEVDGPDEQKVSEIVRSISEMFETKFGEDEFAPPSSDA